MWCRQPFYGVRRRGELFRGHHERLALIDDVYCKHFEWLVAAYLEARVWNITHVDHRCTGRKWPLAAVGQQQGGALEHIDGFLTIMCVALEVVAGGTSTIATITSMLVPVRSAFFNSVRLVWALVVVMSAREKNIANRSMTTSLKCLCCNGRPQTHSAEDQPTPTEPHCVHLKCAQTSYQSQSGSLSSGTSA
jgi:hypothetical protein